MIYLGELLNDEKKTYVEFHLIQKPVSVFVLRWTNNVTDDVMLETYMHALNNYINKLSSLYIVEDTRMLDRMFSTDFFKETYSEYLKMIKGYFVVSSTSESTNHSVSDLEAYFSNKPLNYVSFDFFNDTLKEIMYGEGLDTSIDDIDQTYRSNINATSDTHLQLKILDKAKENKMLRDNIKVLEEKLRNKAVSKRIRLGVHAFASMIGFTFKTEIMITLMAVWGKGKALLTYLINLF